MWSNRRLVALLAVLLAVGVVSAVVLMEQIQPAVPVAGLITANCSPTFPTPVTVNLGTSGQMTFSCNSGAPEANPAFTTSAVVVVIPVITGFVAPYNTSRLYIYDANGEQTTGSCSARTGNQKIESGLDETIPANGWNYCADYIEVGTDGLPQFTIAWTL